MRPELLLEPGERWDAARQAFNLTVDQRPAAIAMPQDADDVADAIRLAAGRGLQVTAQLTGHGAPTLGDLGRTLLLKTDLLTGVDIDPRRARATASAAARWQDVVPAASDLGLATLHGMSPVVGIVGYTLGGGLGWYGRKYGVASNRVTGVELVTASGDRLRVDHDHEPELFWALRGGGGNFGVVTAIEFELLPIPEVFAGALFFPLERAAEVLRAWREWVRTVPDELTSVGRFLHFPPFPAVPEPLRGKAFGIVEAVHIGPESEGTELLAPLRALGPAMDTFAMTPPAGIGGLHMDPSDPAPSASEHQLLTDLTGAAIDELAELAGPGTPLVSLEARHLGGALARAEDGHGALATIPGEFSTFAVGISTPETAAALAERLAAVRAALAPYDAGSVPNFTETAVDPARFFPPETLARLRAVKREVDPDDRFRAQHPLTWTG